uniref:Uncharacterized protein n=1 Tax=Ascaris lumbricoides TaxID=6252 RepID=A0A0M3IHR9_ASCLU
MSNSTLVVILMLLAMQLFSTFSFSVVKESARAKRQTFAYSYTSDYGSGGYGHGLASYFYGTYGGGYNNNYGGINIGSINEKNIDLRG